MNIYSRLLPASCFRQIKSDDSRRDCLFWSFWTERRAAPRRLPPGRKLPGVPAHSPDGNLWLTFILHNAILFENNNSTI